MPTAIRPILVIGFAIAIGSTLIVKLMAISAIVRAPFPAPVKKVEKSDLAMFGGTPGRNMVNTVDKSIPDKPDPNDEKSLKWKADLGSLSYGVPTIANGKVFVGTNNSRPRNPRDTNKSMDGEVEPVDKGILMCFEEETGKFLWQAVHDKLPGGQVRDWPDIGVSSTATVQGDRVYYVSNRCTLVCLDVNGFADGNQGIQTEKYTDKTDADFLWELDMIKELGVFPHNSSMCSPLIVGELVYVVTSNGVDESHINLPRPKAPSFIAVNKMIGKLEWKSSLPGNNIMHGQWSNPAFTDVGGIKQVIFPGGDGWLYSLTADKGELVWKFDANPKSCVYDLGGFGDKCDFIGTPVVHGDMLFIGTGQDPEHLIGMANFYCIDLKLAVENAKKNKALDVSGELVDKIGKDDEGRPKITGKPNPDSAAAWKYGGADDRQFVPRDFTFGRTMSTACVVDGIAYICEIAGYLHCLDAKTGKKYWQFDTKGEIWGSPYFVDGKIYLCSTGDLFVFQHTETPISLDEIDIPGAQNQKDFNQKLKAKRLLLEAEILVSKVEFDRQFRSTPVVANGTLYVMTEDMLYAFKPAK